MAKWPTNYDKLSVAALVGIIRDGDAGTDAAAAASFELNSRLKRMSTAELFQVIFEEDRDDSFAWEAIRVLHTRATPEVFEVARTCVESDDPYRRVRGFNVLSQLGIRYGVPENPFRDRCVALAIRALADPDSDVVGAAAWALVHHDSEEGKATLVKLKEYPDENVRLAVATGRPPR